MEIFINGLQRTGTNYALALFKANVPNTTFTNYFSGHWKHDFYRGHFLNNPPNKILTIIKHPYSWVESICFRNCIDIISYFPNYYLHNPKDHCGPFSINLKNLCKLYEDWYSIWLNVPQVTLLQYEKLLTQRDIQREIFKHFNIKPKQITIPHIVPQSYDFVPERKEIYRNTKTQYLNHKEKQIIKNCFSKDFLKKINYNLK